MPESQTSLRPVPAPAAFPVGFFITLAIALIADLASKAYYFRNWVTTDPNRGFYNDSEFIHLDINTGVAWSLFNDHPEVVQIGTLILIPILFIVYWRWFRPEARPSEHLAFGAILGGALGNAWDRTTALFNSGYGGVRDFISVKLNPIGIDYIWPTFNIADAAICVGFVWLIVMSFITPWQQKKQAAQAAQGGNNDP